MTRIKKIKKKKKKGKREIDQISGRTRIKNNSARKLKEEKRKNITEQIEWHRSNEYLKIRYLKRNEAQRFSLNKNKKKKERKKKKKRTKEKKEKKRSIFRVVNQGL